MHLVFIALTLSLQHRLAGPDTGHARPIVAAFAEGAFNIAAVQTGYSPLFILYDDGTVIYEVRATMKDVQFATVHLTPAEQAALLDSLALEPAFFELREAYDNAPNVTDQTYYTIRAWRGDSVKEVSLRGVLDSTSWLTTLGGRTPRAETPRAFLHAYLLLCNYRHPRAHAWHALSFELILSDFSYARDAPMRWPTGWPTAASPGVYRDSRGRYHLPLTEGQFRTFVKEYSDRIHTRPFLLDGTPWFAEVRIVFPGESRWIAW